MITKFIFAKNQDEMYKFSDKLEEGKFKIQSEADNFIYLRKNNYGNIFIHIALLLIALFYFQFAIFLNLIYFLYNFYVNSIIIFITTETIDKDGNSIEFSDFDDLDIGNKNLGEKRDMVNDFKEVMGRFRK